jgi:uncharacterized repeat protein (TIGR03803 family)
MCESISSHPMIGMKRNLMKNMLDHQSWISSLRVRTANAALSLAVVLLPAFTAQSAQAQSFAVLYSFTGGVDGAFPTSLVRGADTLYGTAYGGGASNAGTLFKLDKSGKLTVLYSFTGGADGGNPEASLVRNSRGTLYGTTNQGGSSDYGVVFSLTTAGNENVLYSFTGYPADGKYPFSSLLPDTRGSFYGTTNTGGAYGYGTVFKVSTSGTETVLHSFGSGTDGAYPYCGLVWGGGGNLYGATYLGGTYGLGTLFKMNKSGSEVVIHSFAGTPADAAGPYLGSLVWDAAGNLYGTTAAGGASNFGTVFRLDKTGNETVLYSFTGGSDGENPYAGLIRDAAGNLYGTTYQGGTSNFGTVFKLDKTGKKTMLYNFTGGADGAYPTARLIRDVTGNLYGTTALGGDSNVGVVFRITL